MMVSFSRPLESLEIPVNQPLADMFRYNSWANLTLLKACRNLSQEQLKENPPGVSGSVAELLTHLVGGQQTFILRTKGRQNEGEIGRHTPWSGFDFLIEVAKTTNDELVRIAEDLDLDHEVGLNYAGRIYNLPVSFILTHALEHGVEHRTEVKVALNLMGVKTPDLDGWSYAMAKGII